MTPPRIDPDDVLDPKKNDDLGSDRSTVDPSAGNPKVWQPFDDPKDDESDESTESTES